MNADENVAAVDLVVPKVWPKVTAGILLRVDGLVHTCV